MNAGVRRDAFSAELQQNPSSSGIWIGGNAKCLSVLAGAGMEMGWEGRGRSGTGAVQWCCCWRCLLWTASYKQKFLSHLRLHNLLLPGTWRPRTSQSHGSVLPGVVLTQPTCSCLLPLTTEGPACPLCYLEVCEAAQVLAGVDTRALWRLPAAQSRALPFRVTFSIAY